MFIYLFIFVGTLPFQNIFYGFFTRWIRKINKHNFKNNNSTSANHVWNLEFWLPIKSGGLIFLSKKPRKAKDAGWRKLSSHRTSLSCPVVDGCHLIGRAFKKGHRPTKSEFKRFPAQGRGVKWKWHAVPKVLLQQRRGVFGALTGGGSTKHWQCSSIKQQYLFNGTTNVSPGGHSPDLRGHVITSVWDVFTQFPKDPAALRASFFDLPEIQTAEDVTKTQNSASIVVWVRWKCLNVWWSSFTVCPKKCCTCV